jgi:phospholipid/cholesterol/gamma-HCH transport system substrate-binding protein
MKKFRHETMAGIFVIVGLLCVGYMTVRLGHVALWEENAYTLSARFGSVSGLRIGNPIEMFGMEIGSVAGFTMDQEDQLAKVTLKIQNGIKIYGDAIASIKTAGLIGDRYIAIDPGGGDDLLENGDIITETESPVDIGDLIGKYAFGGVEKD